MSCDGTSTPPLSNVNASSTVAVMAIKTTLIVKKTAKHYVSLHASPSYVKRHVNSASRTMRMAVSRVNAKVGKLNCLL